MPGTRAPSFGIMTAPQQIDYHEILRTWRDADTIPEIEHAWLFDHLLPIGGDPNGPIYEGWTLLSALAAQTERLRLGLLVTSNRFRPPTMLAKIAATVDVVSGGRLEFGIGSGGRPDSGPALEYLANGLPSLDLADAMGLFAESLTVIRRLWSEDEPFDFDGAHLQLSGALCNPKPVKRPYPPIMIGGRSTPALRLAAEHADTWNTSGADIITGQDGIASATKLSARLDRFCEEIGRDPASISRSLFLRASYGKPERAVDAICRGKAAGFDHFILGLTAPYPEGVAQWVASEIIAPSR